MLKKMAYEDFLEKFFKYYIEILVFEKTLIFINRDNAKQIFWTSNEKKRSKDFWKLARVWIPI